MQRNPIALPALAALAACLVAGCGVRREVTPNTGFSPASKAATGADGTATVAAPSVAKPTLEAVLAGFGEHNPGVAVEVTYRDGSEAEAVTADLSLALAADADGTHLADLPVVLAASRGNPLKVKSVEQLAAHGGLRVAVPDAASDAAGAVFESWIASKDPTVAGSVTRVPVGDDSAACGAVCDGTADFAVTVAPRVMFGEYAPKLCVAFYLDRDSAEPVRLSAAPASDASPAAEALLEFLTSTRGQAAFRRFGMEPAIPPSPEDAEKSLFIPCGAGLQPAMDRLGDIYFERTGVRTDFCYAGSGMLLAQLAFTQRGDLYMPGEGFWVTLAAKREFIAEKTAVVYFVPVIGVPTGNPKNIHSLEDLARPGVRVCMGDPEALAVGPVTVHVLERAGLLEDVKKNVAMTCGCIPELANALSMKSADAGIIWDAVAYQYQDEIEAIEIPVELNETAEVLIATLTVSRQPEEAKRFMDFVASDEAAGIFREEGFLTECPEGMRIAPQDAPGG